MSGRRRLWLFLVLALFVFAGCYTVPFEKPKMVRLKPDVNPEKIVSTFRNRLPKQYQTESTLIFHFLWKEIAALGYAKIDYNRGSFEVLCVNHLGIQLFHIGGDAGGHYLRYALPQFKKYPGFLDAVAGDIRHIYFTLTPGKKSQIEIERDRIVFTDCMHEDARCVEHVFGGAEKLLLKKRGFSDGELVREALFYEYASEAGKVFPKGIVLHNGEHGYRLTVRTRGFQLASWEPDEKNTANE